MLHIEFFATPTARRSTVLRKLKAVYAIAGTTTKGRGGDGPWSYLIEPKRDRRTSPTIRRCFNIRPNEDLWVEVAFYPSRPNLRRTIREIWKRPDFLRVVHAAESLNAKRPRSSSVDLGRLKAN